MGVGLVGGFKVDNFLGLSFEHPLVLKVCLYHQNMNCGDSSHPSQDGGPLFECPVLAKNVHFYSILGSIQTLENCRKSNRLGSCFLVTF